MKKERTPEEKDFIRKRARLKRKITSQIKNFGLMNAENTLKTFIDSPGVLTGASNRYDISEKEVVLCYNKSIDKYKK